MNQKQEFVTVRRAYAKQLLASVKINDARLEAAFADVERERFLGPGPWLILRASGYTPTPDADPVYLYCDVLVGIIPERGLNKRMPSYHAPTMVNACPLATTSSWTPPWFRLLSNCTTLKLHV
jgi:protein-L-isoaspartate(D-aspartate) O-methyltransferase